MTTTIDHLFSARVADAALFLDLDGTIADIAPRPGDVGPDPGRTALLSRAVEALDGRLAVLSGRAVDDVDRILESRAVCVAGVHGLQWRTPDGQIRQVEPHPALADVRETFQAVAKARPGLLVEEKPVSLALHYRAAPAAGEAVIELAERLAEDRGLVLQKGRMVAELRTPGPDKGEALLRFMSQAPFNGAIPIVLGDDQTDEAAFEAARGLGGFGILVGEPRPTLARAGLPDPAAALAWIADGLSRGVFSIGGRS